MAGFAAGTFTGVTSAGMTSIAGAPTAHVAGVLTSIGRIDVGSIPTKWLRDSHQTPATPKTHIEVKFIVMTHRLSLLK
jgi:hypothetical protein